MRYLLLLICFSGYSQIFTYNGNVSAEGYPLPGATICVSGTNNCTTSDLDGNYSIQVKKGDVLAINFVGMSETRLTINGPSGLQRVNGQAMVLPMLNDAFSAGINKENDTVQVSAPTGTVGNFNFENYSYADVALIKKTPQDVYFFKRRSEYAKLYLELYTEFTAGTPIRLQNFQSQYSQGRGSNGAAVYQGPETNEVFSWGAPIASLYTTGNATPYYPGGDLAPGSGTAVRTYNRNSFFRNTFEQKTTLSARLLFKDRSYLKLNLGYRNSNIALPVSKNDEFNAALAYNAAVKRHTFNGNINIDRYENGLTNTNFIHNKAIFANAITPAHFDSNAGTLLPNGLPRNFSTLENNPYYMLRNTRDKNSSTQLGLFFSDAYRNDELENTVSLTSQYSDIKDTGGNLPFAALISNPGYYVRDEKYTSLTLADNFKHGINYRGHVGGTFTARFQDRNLARTYNTGYTGLESYPDDAAESYKLGRQQNRFETGLNLNADYRFEDVTNYNDYLRMEATGGFMYSNTVKNSVYTNASLGFDWANFVFNKIGLFGSTGFKNYEPELQNNNLYFNSLAYRTDQFKQMDNNRELFTPNTTTPTTERSYTAGLRYDDNFNVIAEVYRKNISNLYAPVFNGTDFSWQPAVDYYQNGLEVTLEYNNRNRYYYGGYTDRLQWSLNANFTTYRNEVTAISGGYNRIAMAGFADVNKNYMVGQPLGAIVGSAYNRDANGNMIIGADGFPTVAAAPKVLGNPNPDFVVGFSPGVYYKHFSLKFNFDWSQGGELWNGTQQTLNYYGASAVTAAQRNVTGYVFPGVTQSGQPNTQPVSFYDAGHPVTQNRWTRYGIAGVAEDAIEDATYFRLNNITLSYSKLAKYDTTETFNITVSAFINNVFILSKSDTAFAANSLFNSSETSALDYFNSPMLRTYGLSLAVKF